MTTPSMESYSLAQLVDLRPISPELANVAERLLVVDYEDFVRVLIRDINSWIKIAEEDPGIRSRDREDRLSTDLCTYLRGMSYDASREQLIGGHCDITVRHRLGFLWLCEAKVHSDYDYLMKGFRQLCDRYSTGTPSAIHGGLLIYARVSNIPSLMETWRQRLRGEGLPDYDDMDCEDDRGAFAFCSRHQHSRTGLTYTVRHMAVSLKFSPTDRKPAKVKKKPPEGG